MHQLTGDFYTVGEVLGHTLAGIGVSLGLSMNFEAVTARYVDVRLERKKEVLDAYHGAVKQADPAKAEKAEGSNQIHLRTSSYSHHSMVSALSSSSSLRMRSNAARYRL